MKKVVKHSSISQIVHILGQLWRISTEPFQCPKNGSNLNFTFIEKVAGMTIFHGVSRHKIDEEDLEAIEKICTKNKPGVNATVSLENADPHLFKIVVWNENSA